MDGRDKERVSGNASIHTVGSGSFCNLVRSKINTFRNFLSRPAREEEQSFFDECRIEWEKCSNPRIEKPC